MSMSGQFPRPPREFLDELTDVSDRAAAAYGWQAGYAAAVAAGAAVPFDPVRAPAAVTQLYVLAVIEELVTSLNTVRGKYIADLTGEEPFKLFRLMMERVQREESGG